MCVYRTGPLGLAATAAQCITLLHIAPLDTTNREKAVTTTSRLAETRSFGGIYNTRRILLWSPILCDVRGLGSRSLSVPEILVR